MFTLRDYQSNGVEAGLTVMLSKTPKKGALVSPTGGGKSLYIAAIANNIDYPLIVLQPSKELLEQNYLKYKALGGEASIYSTSMKKFQRKKEAYTIIEGEELKCEEIGHVTYATIGSILKDWEKFKNLKVRGIIIDECHLGTKGSNKIKTFINKVKIKNVLGLTATPIYLETSENGATLKIISRVRSKLFSDITHVTQISELVKNKYWSPLVYRSFKTDGTALVPNSTGADFSDESTAEYYDTNNLKHKIKDVVEKLEEQGIRKSILIFVPTIAHAEELSRMIKGSAVVHGKTPHKKRSQIIYDFKTLKTKVVINVNVLSVGFDHPQLDTIITGRPTMSMAIYYQQLGRGVRIHPEKKSCAILDFAGNVNRFGKIETLTFENIEGYGWGMFQDNRLLTDYPIAYPNKPRKDKLKHGFVLPTGMQTMLFGVYKGERVRDIAKNDREYLIHAYNKNDFFGYKGQKLKEDIKTHLKL